MAGTEGTTKPEADVKAEGTTKNEQAAPTKKVRKYFLPETGEVVEAESASAAAEAGKAKEGKKG